MLTNKNKILGFASAVAVGALLLFGYQNMSTPAPNNLQANQADAVRLQQLINRGDVDVNMTYIPLKAGIDNLIAAKVQAKDCSELHSAEPTLTSGYYRLYPLPGRSAVHKGVTSVIREGVLFYCDMTVPASPKMIFVKNFAERYPTLIELSKVSELIVGSNVTSFERASITANPPSPTAIFSEVLGAATADVRRNIPGRKLVLSYGTKSVDLIGPTGGLMSLHYLPSLVRDSNSAVFVQAFYPGPQPPPNAPYTNPSATYLKINEFKGPNTWTGWYDLAPAEDLFPINSSPAITKIADVTYVAIAVGKMLKVYQRAGTATAFSEILRTPLPDGAQQINSIGIVRSLDNQLWIAALLENLELYVTKYKPGSYDLPDWQLVDRYETTDTIEMRAGVVDKIRMEALTGDQLRLVVQRANTSAALQITIKAKSVFGPGACSIKNYLTENPSYMSQLAGLSGVPSTGSKKTFETVQKHYLKYGKAAGSCVPFEEKCTSDEYITKYIGLTTTPKDPMVHYSQIGADQANCRPYVPFCSEQSYYQKFPAIKTATTNSTEPWLHYLSTVKTSGVKAGTCRPVLTDRCTQAEYLKQNPSVANDPVYKTKLGEHYVMIGIKNSSCEPSLPTECETASWKCVGAAGTPQLVKVAHRKSLADEVNRISALRYPITTCPPQEKCDVRNTGSFCVPGTSAHDKCMRAKATWESEKSKVLASAQACLTSMVVGSQIPTCAVGMQFME